MPRTRGIKPQFAFLGGLRTEVSDLDYPDGFFEDGANIELDVTGEVRRRLGLDVENTYQFSSTSLATGTISTYAIDTFIWRNVAGDGNRNFLVMQVGPTLHFYDVSTDPISGNAKSFTIDLTTFSAPAATDVAGNYVYMDSGKQRLFVVGSQIEPFFVTYDVDLDTITSTQIDIKVRDFEGLEDSLTLSEQPVSLTDEHNYNLKNQGWVEAAASSSDPIVTYFNAQAVYPANNQQWWIGKNTSGVFTPSLLDKTFFGETPAFRGHYILDRFNKDRATASGIAGITTETEDERPESIAFGAGRAFYAFKDEVLYSQIIESDENIPKCHQSADPTSEEISDLLATDGGVIPIPEAGEIKALRSIGSGIIVFATNGIWFISGPDGNFKATDFFATKVSGVGTLSNRSIVDVEGIPVWWSNDGIYTIQVDQISQAPTAVNLTDSTIKSFYFDIPALSREFAKGVYDSKRREVRWLYYSGTTTPTDTPYKYDRYLTLDTRLQAFVPGTFEDFGDVYPVCAGAFTLPGLNVVDSTNNIVVDGDNMVIDGDNLVAGTSKTSVAGSTLSTKYVILDVNPTNISWTFGELNNTSFTDFETWDSDNSVGAAMSSYIVTGPATDSDVARIKQAPYIHCYFRRTETAFVLSGSDYIFDRESSCNLQAQWQWADSAAANRWSTAQQVYRFRQSYFVDPLDLTFDPGFDIIVTKNKLRGKGQSYKLKYSSEAGKDFQLLGWSLQVEGNQQT